MNVIDLLARLKGEILANKARAVIDGKIVVLARLNGEDWEYTEAGQELANMHSNQVVAEADAVSTRTRKTKEVVAQPVAVESSEVAPEQ